MWSFQLNFTSIVTLRNVLVCSLCISGYLSKVKELDFEFKWKRNILGFSELKVRLLFAIQILRLSIAFSVSSRFNCRFSPCVAMADSSAGHI